MVKSMPKKPGGPRLYFDVTQLAHWQGKVTGIPRVMDELAKRFHRQADNVTFIAWVTELKDFCEIDFETTILKRDGIAYKTTAAADHKSAVAKPQSRQLRLIPSAGTRQVIKKGLSVSSRLNPRMAQKLESRAKQIHMSGYQRVQFQHGDILFIPWGEWWNPDFSDYLLAARQQGARLVQIIHDVAPTVWPQFFEQVKVSPVAYNAKIVPQTDLVLAVSENTKRELSGWLKQQGLAVPPIRVFRNGDDLSVSKSRIPEEASFNDSGLKGQDYIMCVGTIEAKKNHMLFYYVYKLAKARGIKLPKLVIVGRKGWHSEFVYDLMTLDPEVKDQFVFLHNAGDEELSWLYDHCLFTVLASFHEGWGIPIAESLARGVPCISANTSSMVEIAEGIVGHFSPASSDECLSAITDMLKPAKLKAARQKAQSYRQTSWDESFSQISKYLEEML